MPINPVDVGEIEKALNEAAGKASVLWTTFVTFQLYLAIAFGSVTHRDLFLENPIRLPLLNVDLPLVAFFVVAPVLLLVFHFYVFLQLLILKGRAETYDRLLRSQCSKEQDRQVLRQKLDSFLVLQFLAGPAALRRGVIGLSLRAITWLTLVGAPVLILLQAQLTFLAYHDERVVWLQRIAIVIDVALIWYFWQRIVGSEDKYLPSAVLRYFWQRVRGGDQPAARISGKAWRNLGWRIIGVAGSLGLLLFSLCIASFPEEAVDALLPSLQLVPATWPPTWSVKSDWASLHDLLFVSQPDEVKGKPGSWLSNRLVLTDQSFVDSDKLDKAVTSRSFRGCDLKRAALDRVDLRRADFTGARLQGVSLTGATLEGAKLGLAQLQGARLDGAQLQAARLDGAQLQGASLQRAQLQEASLAYANLRGATLSQAQLQGARMDWAQLQEAGLYGAQLQGAELFGAALQGAKLFGATFLGASLDSAQLQGALLIRAQLQGASLDGALLQGASLDGAHLQGASVHGAQLQGASLKDAFVWRTVGTPEIDFADLNGVDWEATPWTVSPSQGFQRLRFVTWRNQILNNLPPRLRDRISTAVSVLDPSKVSSNFNPESWKQAREQTQDPRELDEYLMKLACLPVAAPYVARHLLQAGRLRAGALDKLCNGKSSQGACPGVKGFTDIDWRVLDDNLDQACEARPQH